MTVDMGWDQDTTLEEAVLQSVGAGSVCWDVDGVFMPDLAGEIADELLDFINRHFMPVPPDSQDGNRDE